MSTATLRTAFGFGDGPAGVGVESDARRFAREANESTKKRKAAEERNHAARLREIDAGTEAARAAGPFRVASATVRPGARSTPSLNATDVYAARREGRDRAQSSEAALIPDRPASFGELAAAYYGGGRTGLVSNVEPIATSPRGGIR